LFPRARGGRVSEFSYGADASGTYRYQAADLSLVAPHLFQGFSIVDLAFVSAPYQILWCVSSNGNLVACTYVPEQQVAGWHHHSTLNGTFESVCAVGEGDEDAVYVIVNRTINGQQTRYVERMHTREFATQADAFFVDAGATYNGAPVDTITTGLDHLEGETVSILADGGVLPQQVVTGGAITLQFPASTITVGLPLVAQLQTLPATLQIDAFGAGRVKNVNKAYLRLVDSSGMQIGPSFDNLTQIKIRTTEPYGTPPALQTGEIEQLLPASWQQDGSVCLQQSDPLPVTVASLSFEIAIGG